MWSPKMAEEKKLNTVSPTPRAESSYKHTSVSIQIITLSEATVHSQSEDAKHPDLTPSPTISISLSASVLKSPVWRTEFVTRHTQNQEVSLHRKLSAENYLRREH